LWQFGLQYFYVDKFAGQTDTFGQYLITGNAIFIGIKAIFFLKCIHTLLKSKQLHETGRTRIMLAFQALLPLIVTIARAYGGIYQVFYVAPNVRGACLRNSTYYLV